MPGPDILQVICDYLNRQPDWGFEVELRRLVSAWQASGPNLDAMLKSDPELCSKIRLEFRAVYHPTWTGRAYMVFSPHGDPRDPSGTARGFFMMLTLSPYCDKFAGPCARCGKYYLKKNALQKVYCSRSCGNNTTAAKRTRERYHEAREQKLNGARRAIRKWERATTNEPWKVFVSRLYPGLTSKFLTRAVSRKNLSEPKKRQ
jgi:hypothetical protein